MSDPTLHILFLGTSSFAIPSLNTLAKEPRFHVDAVITQPDRPIGRKQILTPPPTKIAAQNLNLPVLQPEDLRKDFSALGLERPDFLVVVSYGQILSQEILDFPRIAPVNVHGSLLPRFRGASPIQHALLAGDKETGVTIQHMVKELDAGPILAQGKVTIEPRDTFVLLHDRLAAMGAELLQNTLIAPLLPVPQPTEGIVRCGKLDRKDGDVDPSSMTAEEIDRKVRALTPWPGVTMTFYGEPVKILETDLQPQPRSTPLPCAGNSTLHLVTVLPAGKKPMSGAEWKRGRQ